MNTLYRWRKHASKIAVVVALIGGFALNPFTASASVNFHLWISADDDFDVYVGSATSASTLALSANTGWNFAHFLSLTLNVGDYIYVPAADIAAGRWGLGGYTSTDGGATWTPILPNAPHWEVVYVDGNYTGSVNNQVMNLTTLNATIANANSNSLWMTPVAGTAVAGIGLPSTYGTLPAQGSIWVDVPNGGHGHQSPYMRVLFRYQVVPEPASMVALGVGLAGLVGLRRRRK